MKAILRSINNFSCKLKQCNNLKYNISPKIRSNKFKSISGDSNITIEDALGKNLKDYKIYGNTKPQLLPDGYTQVDYIESSGTQYIDTGFIPNQDTSVYTKISTLTVSSTGNKTIFGSRVSSRSGHFGITIGATQWYTGYGTDQIATGLIATSNTQYEIKKEKEVLTLNSNQYTQTSNDFTSPGDMYIFAMNQNNETIAFAPIQLYYFKIYDDTTLVRDFIPCYRNSDNEVGLYDLVNNVFYTNQGTGVFTYGSVTPTPYAPIEMVSCGDRTKNLCGELEQGSYNDTNGTKLTSTTNYRNKEPIKVLPNTNYIFSINGVGQAVNVFEYKADGTYIGRIGSSAVSSNSYFTTSSETGYINIFRGASAGIEKWQIEQNDTISSYEPYGYKIPVNVRSENFFSPEYAVETQYFIGGGTSTSHFYTLENNKIIMEYPNVGGARYLNKIKLSAGTYYLKAKLSQAGEHTTSIFRYAIRDFTNNVAIVSSTSATVTNDFSLSFTILEELDISIMLIPNNTSDGTLLIENVMLSKIDEPYQPYYNETTNIYLDEPLRKIDEYSDYIDFVNGKVARRIKEVLLSSENNWVSAHNARPVFSLSTFTDKLDGRDNFICSHFKYLGNAQQTDLGFAMSFNSRQYYRYLYIQVPSSIAGIAEVSNFKTWFGTIEPITLDYPLETPTEESIELPNIELIEGKNIITLGTELTGTIEIEYYSNEIIDISDYEYKLRKVED